VCHWRVCTRTAVVVGHCFIKHKKHTTTSGASRRLQPPAGRANHLRRACLAQSYPGQNPPFWDVTRPVHPYKSAIQRQFTIGNAKGAQPPPAGPDRRPGVAAARLGYGRVVTLHHRTHIHFRQDSLRDSAPLFLTQRCDHTKFPC
jgi:hypothetical protein